MNTRTEKLTAQAVCRPVELDGLRVVRGGHVIIEDLTLAVDSGITLLLGDNGAGKSTLLMALMGLIPAAGERRLLGHPHAGRALGWPEALAARVAFLPERFVPPWHLTGWECLQWALALRGQRLDRRAAQTLAQRLQLAPEALERAARAFSKGMTQKLGLMTVLLSAAEFIILDEPASGLDPTSRLALLAEFASAARQGRSLLLSTHALGDVLWLQQSCADVPVRLLLMRAGRLVAQARVDEAAPGGEWRALERWYRQGLEASPSESLAWGEEGQ
ncbi:MAG: ABC transporter ATP-binding protein [Tepidimonas sp.]|uniref:ATP-binding cassette domain-containing protein n=1 Tax=Tepidimonas sp. TaxID=2002775 RepID=UPI00259F002A|nr:ABC transporter ATP-binding protein [Tepidimonas sp.]MDM7456200.1 ABC transporter ATP-binding protein [Tepidimonas sp.]